MNPDIGSAMVCKTLVGVQTPVNIVKTRMAKTMMTVKKAWLNFGFWILKSLKVKESFLSWKKMREKPKQSSTALKRNAHCCRTNSGN